MDEQKIKHIMLKQKVNEQYKHIKFKTAIAVYNVEQVNEFDYLDTTAMNEKGKKIDKQSRRKAKIKLYRTISRPIVVYVYVTCMHEEL